MIPLLLNVYMTVLQQEFFMVMFTALSGIMT